MHPGILNYTVGNYGESPEGTLSASGPALLAQSLAWAVNNGVPFHEIILTLTQNGSAGFNRVLFLLPRSKKWEKCLWKCYSDLVEGLPLHKTLRKRFAYFLPEYYLQAVEKAENEGHLKEVLPVFAKRLNLSCETSKYYKRALMLPFLEFMVICCILTPMCIFIFPNINKILEDFSSHDVHLNWIGIVLAGVVGAWDLIFTVAFYYFLFYLLGRIFPRARRFVVMLLEEIFIFIPPFRKRLINIALLELSSSMASYLDIGEDILTAAEFSRSSCNHFWLRRKLKKFIDKMQKGENWLAAWDSMSLRQNLSECIIRNAAAKENISAGFDTMSDWFYHKQLSTVKKNGVLLFSSGILINSVIVFLLMFYVFQLLIQVIGAAGDM